MHKHILTLKVHQVYSASGTKEDTSRQWHREHGTQVIYRHVQLAKNHGP